MKTISISDEKLSSLESNDVNKREDESYDENDSEYEDVEEDESDDINNPSILTSITNKNPSKVQFKIFYFISFFSILDYRGRG